MAFKFDRDWMFAILFLLCLMIVWGILAYQVTQALRGV